MRNPTGRLDMLLESCAARFLQSQCTEREAAAIAPVLKTVAQAFAPSAHPVARLITKTIRVATQARIEPV